MVLACSQQLSQVQSDGLRFVFRQIKAADAFLNEASHRRGIVPTLQEARQIIGMQS